ncbi:MAG: BamA/TamA family outer membrane protein [Polyangiaceae bacterium]
MKSEKAEKKLDPRRFEWAGFPIIGGNSDIGVEGGVAATFTRFREGIFPYLWNLDVVLSASAKDDPSFAFIQQADVLRLDAPDLANHHLRLDTRGSFTRTINEGYYGIGNASSPNPGPGETTTVRLNQYIAEEARIREIARVHTGTMFDLALGGNLRYEWPSIYAGSRLAVDSVARNPDGSPLLYGVQNEGLAGIAAGVILDTRDNEFITTHGIYYQVGFGGTVGSGEHIGYAQASAVLAHYAPLVGPLIFASRIVADWEFGNVPFYDLQQGGIFEPQYLVGAGGIRGVPEGRYAGAAKVIGNVEIRIPFPRFVLLGQRLRLGTTTFFDAGRVWASYKGGADVAHDGTTLGLRYGVGGGVFLQWGEAAIFRVEAAYSPDAESENPGFPIGIYVSDGLMF